MPETVSPVKKLQIIPAWDLIADAATQRGLVNASGLSTFLEHQRLRFPPAVSLHILLCVFLN